MAVLQRSTGTTLNANINVATARELVADGQATIITPGLTGYDTVRLASVALDTALGNATLGAPVLLGVDDIYFLPLQYPEPAAGL